MSGAFPTSGSMDGPPQCLTTLFVHLHTYRIENVIVVRLIDPRYVPLVVPKGIFAEQFSLCCSVQELDGRKRSRSEVSGLPPRSRPYETEILILLTTFARLSW